MLRKIYCLSERIVAINLSWNCKSKSIKEYFLVKKWLYDCPLNWELLFPKESLIYLKWSSYVQKGAATGK